MRKIKLFKVFAAAVALFLFTACNCGGAPPAASSHSRLPASSSEISISPSSLPTSIEAAEEEPQIIGATESFIHEYKGYTFFITLPQGLYPEFDGIHQDSLVVPDYVSAPELAGITFSKVCYFIDKGLEQKEGSIYTYREYPPEYQ